MLPRDTRLCVGTRFWGFCWMSHGFFWWKRRVSFTPLLDNSCYNIIFCYKGVVITRNREVNGTDIWPMTAKTAGGWYVLETNYDHWKEPLFLDNRRGPANNCMQKMTVQVDSASYNFTAFHLTFYPQCLSVCLLTFKTAPACFYIFGAHNRQNIFMCCFISSHI